MTREIKFRAWDKNKKKWATGFFISETGELYSGYIPDEFNVDSDLELLQFTGLHDKGLHDKNLHDKNGKEIYEGDILTNDGEDIGDTTTKAVFAIKNYIKDTNSLKSCICGGCTFRIIGNIYENPELLK